MKVLAVQGSPRKNGNTDILLDRVLAVLAEQKAADVDKVYARDLDMQGCIECLSCQKAEDEPGCSLKDDMTAIYDKILEADLVILASPVFCWGFTAQIKAVLDRLYATFKFSQDPYVCLMEGQRFALIVTAGGDANDGADVCAGGYASLIKFSRAVDCGTFLAPLLKEPSDTQADAALLAKADAFASDLAGQLD